jgi:ribosomal protein L27
MHTGATNTIADSNFTVLGSDEVLYVVQDGAIFYEKDTNKEYIISNNTWTEL